MSGKNYNVAVVGAGVIGLSTALNLLEDLPPNSNVTVFGDEFGAETTSDGAAGAVRPVYFSGDDDVKWLKTSFDYFMKLSNSEKSTECGASLLSFYVLSNSMEELMDAPYEGTSHGARNLTDKELQLWPGDWRYGKFFTGCIIECRKYLPHLQERIKSRGGTILKRHIYTLEELIDDFDVVVNCSGFGARNLVNDSKVTPVRGQLLRVHAPWIKHAVFATNKIHMDTYVIPGADNVVVGGTRQTGKWSREISVEDREDIWRRATTLIPSLKDAKVEREWVGLRPFRDPVRLEKEVMEFGKGRLKVVHNYGHGSGGVSLSWGCAKDASKLVCNFLSTSNSKY